MTDDIPRAAGPAGGRRPIRIANFSGALGDYLAEMTMARVAGGFAARRDQAGAELSDYFVSTFLK